MYGRRGGRKKRTSWKGIRVTFSSLGPAGPDGKGRVKTARRPCRRMPALLSGNRLKIRGARAYWTDWRHRAWGDGRRGRRWTCFGTGTSSMTGATATARSKPLGARELEAQVAWLVRHHCANKEIVKVLPILLGRRVTERAVKHELERLAARLRLRGRTVIARRVERLIEEYRAARERCCPETKPADAGSRPAEGRADLRPERRRRGPPRPRGDGGPDGHRPSPP